MVLENALRDRHLKNISLPWQSRWYAGTADHRRDVKRIFALVGNGTQFGDVLAGQCVRMES